MAIIEFINVCKSYGNSKKVIDKLDLKIEKGDFVTILGKSGCGKTTLLKMVNKLITPDSGKIIINGKDINLLDSIELRRGIGYVIQQVGLFPHLTIRDNISYVLSLLKSGKNLKNRRSSELLTLVGLDKAYLDKYPNELSGGQKQRIGVARALAADPNIVLMDEPFGAVDEITRTQLQDELLRIHQSLNKTVLFVTHDIEEALKLGSKIIIINNGSVEQVGKKEDLIFNPKSSFVSSFLGYKGFKSILSDNHLESLYNDAKLKYKEL